MKAILYLFSLLAAFSLAAEDLPIKISTRWLGDRLTMQKGIRVAVESYANELQSIRDALRATQPTSDGQRRAVIDQSIKTLDAILEHQNTEIASNLIPLVNLLHANNTDESPQIVGTIGNSQAEGTLNYLISAIFAAEIQGEADSVSEEKLEAMLRFYAGNPSQSVEGSWQMNNTMLFVFGDRLVDCLVAKTPDRLAAFYKAVQDSRQDSLNGPGADEEPIPEAERPTSEQLRRYEGAYAKLQNVIAGNPTASEPERPHVEKKPQTHGCDPEPIRGHTAREPLRSTPGTASQPILIWPWLAGLVALVITAIWIFKGRS